mgnify:CR=1 FL=1
MKQGMAKRTGQNKAQINAFLGGVMNQLEASRQSVDDATPITDERVGKEYVENFALKIFLKADNEDRSSVGTGFAFAVLSLLGHADACAMCFSKTARVFLAAATFLEVLNAFGEVDGNIAEKIRYSKWRAAEILRADKEGRAPVPPPSVEPESGSSSGGGGGLEQDTDEPSASFPTSHSAPPPNPFASYGQTQQTHEPVLPPRQPVGQHPSPTMAAHAAAPLEDDDIVPAMYDPQIIAVVQKHARHVISALQFDDVDTALDLLEKATEQLRAAKAQFAQKHGR